MAWPILDVEQWLPVLALKWAFFKKIARKSWKTEGSPKKCNKYFQISLYYFLFISETSIFTRTTFFTYIIKYAKVCTGIYRAKALTNGKRNILAFLRFEKAFSESFWTRCFTLYHPFSTSRTDFMWISQQHWTSSAILKQANFSFVPTH